MLDVKDCRFSINLGAIYQEKKGYQHKHLEDLPPKKFGFW